MKTDFVLELDQQPADVLVLATYEDADTAEFQKYDKILNGLLSALKGKGELLGKRKKTKLLHLNQTKLHYRALIIAGLGEEKTFSLARYLNAIEAGVRTARKEGYGHVAVLVQELPGPAATRGCGLVTAAAQITARVFDRYRVETKKDIQYIKRLTIVGTDEKQKTEFEQGTIVAAAVNRTRDLQDAAPGDLYPENFAAEARKSVKYGLKCTVFDEKDLAKKGYNAILAVGKGSAHKPRLIVLKYRGAKKGKTVCLVGKGITFDAGGINLKPSGYLEEMKHDMAGAAVVLGIMEAIARLKLKINVIGIMGMAENVMGSDSYHPSDVIRTASGITVEVGNTDAEGRLVLADALHHSQQYKPDHTIDFATLTGAAMVALGTFAAPIMGNDQELIDALIAHGEAVGERLWQFPLWEEFEDDLESDVADLKNMGYKREAGAIAAGVFLKQFAGGSWAHLDIAGPAIVERPRLFTEKGGSGFAVRLVIDWLSTL